MALWGKSADYYKTANHQNIFNLILVSGYEGIHKPNAADLIVSYNFLAIGTI